jgi:hypothetical protein
MSSLSPGGALGGPGEEGWTPKNTILLYIFTHRTPGSKSSSDMVTVLVWSLCRVLALGVAWVGLGGLCEVWWEEDKARGSRPHKGGFAKKCRRLKALPALLEWRLQHVA